jgi:endonuclease-8
LLDQEIFAGVGNIIKNESLFITRINPETKVCDLREVQIKELIKNTHEFSWNFYKWRKKIELKKHYQIYRKSVCPNCGTKVIRENTGKRVRRSFWCPICQPLQILER